MSHYKALDNIKPVEINHQQESPNFNKTTIEAGSELFNIKTNSTMPLQQTQPRTGGHAKLLSETFDKPKSSKTNSEN